MLPPALASLAPLFVGVVLSPTQAMIASAVVVLVVIIAWKFLKLAFKLALVLGAAIVIFLVLRWAGIL